MQSAIQPAMTLRIVLSRAKPHVRVALAPMMNAGLDPPGALKLRKDQIDGDTIWGMRGMTGEEGASHRCDLADGARQHPGA